MQIVVLGMHRSGTSAVTGLLVRLGAYFGAPEIALPKNFDNPRGFSERLDVMRVNDELLNLSCADWTTPQLYDPEIISEPCAAVFRQRARAIAAELAAQPLSVVKDPRMCVMADVWLPHLPRRVCLLVLRNPLAVAMSLEKRNALPLPVGIALWEIYARGAVRASTQSLRVVLDFDALMMEPAAHTRQLIESLRAAGAGTHLAFPTETDLREAIDPGLRHHLPDPGELRRASSAAQFRLHEQLQARAFDEVMNGELSAESRKALDAQAGAARLFQHRCWHQARRARQLVKRVLKSEGSTRT